MQITQNRRFSSFLLSSGAGEARVTWLPLLVVVVQNFFPFCQVVFGDSLVTQHPSVSVTRRWGGSKGEP